MYRVLVIGAVNTTRHTLVQLIDHEFDIVGVLGHEPKYPSKISGWADLKEVSKGNDLNYKGFKKINDADNIEWAKKKKPDIIFAVGFSQLMKDDWLNMPTLGCIGFHPTNLPKGRGRAPIAWTVLEENKGSATFFLMGKGADDGPIFVQELFDVDKDDDAAIIESKIESAIKKSLKRWLPDLKKGNWDPTPQDDDKASWYGKRTQEDGVINWNDSAQYIDKLIKASTHPHPGAYTFLKDSKLIVWQCQLEDNIPIKGVIGRILLKDQNKGCLVQCGEGLIWINNIESYDNIQPKVGEKLGYNSENEIYKIKKQLKRILSE